MGYQGRVRAVLFDLDGTLLDSLKDLADSMNAVLAARGYPSHPVEAYKAFVGEGMETLVRRALPWKNPNPALVADSLGAMRQEYGLRWHRHTRPYRGVPALLDALKDRSTPCAVLSNKPHEFTCACVARLLPRWTFSAVLGASDETPRKPDPAGALTIAARLGVEPGSFLFLGDGPTDIQAASAAGMVPVAALWGFRSESELKAAGAHLLISQPLDLLQLL